MRIFDVEIDFKNGFFMISSDFQEEKSEAEKM